MVNFRSLLERAEQARRHLAEGAQAVARGASRAVAHATALAGELSAERVRSVEAELDVMEARPAPGDATVDRLQVAGAQWRRAERVVLDLLARSAERAELAEERNRRFLQSTSWRITRPLRAAIYVLRRQVGWRELILLARRPPASIQTPVPVATEQQARPPSPPAPAPDVEPPVMPVRAHPSPRLDLGVAEDRLRHVLAQRMGRLSGA